MNCSFPEVVRIEPASACNLRCIHCPTGTLQAPRTVMSPELFDIIRSQLTTKNIRVFVLYHGGEPFLNRYIFDFIEKLRLSHPTSFIKIVSNGMLLDDEVISDICQSSLNHIEFSLDGLSPDESSNIRRGSDASKIIQIINKLLQQISHAGSTLKVSVSTTQFFDKSHECLSPLTIKPAVPEWLIGSFNGVVDFKSHWAMVWPRMCIEDGFSIVEYDDQLVRNQYIDECSHLSETITIRANGDVVPCCYDLMSDLVMGNVRSSSLAKIWNSSSYNQLRASISIMQPPSTCSNCNVIRKKKRYLIRAS
jgi:radical SAM protein with 4Fe4S-binding SPASM domain